MKALITICFASLASITATAQSQPTMLSQSRYSIDYNGNSVLEDSLVHNHSNGRVSYGRPEVKENRSYCPNDGVYKADVSTRVYKSPSSSDLVDRMTRAFNANGSISVYREQLKPSSVYKEVYKEWYDYNANMQLTTQWATNHIELRRLIYLYQNNARIAKRYELEIVAPGQVWDLYAIDSFKSNGTDSFYTRHGANLQPYERHHYLRDTNMRIVVDSFFGAAALTSVTHTSYDTAGRKLQDSISSGLNMGHKHNILYRYDGNGNMVSKTHYGMPNTRDTMTYNAANQLTSVKTYTVANNTPAPGSFWRYYYYGFPTAVSDVATTNEPLRLYPVPATSYINIDMNFSKPEKFSVRIFDMQGQTVRQWEEPAQASYKKQVLLDGMPAGNYIMHISSASQNITRNFNVIN